MKRKIAVAVFGVIIVSLLGCVTAKFSEPIASFQEGVNKTSFIVSKYYENVNNFEREVYLYDCMYDPKKELLLYEKGNPTPLMYGILSPESIKARTDALVLIGIYVNRLRELCGNNSSVLLSKGEVKLGGNLEDLGAAFADLARSDLTAMNYSGPISKLLAAIRKIYLISSRNQAIEQAVKVGKPAVNKILTQLQKDLNNVIVPLQNTGLKQRIAEMSAYYNKNKSKFSLSRRRSELFRISAIVKEYNVLVNSNPANLIQEMKQANNALARYAKSVKTPKDYSKFMSAIERFNRSVDLFTEKTK